MGFPTQTDAPTGCASVKLEHRWAQTQDQSGVYAPRGLEPLHGN